MEKTWKEIVEDNKKKQMDAEKKKAAPMPEHATWEKLFEVFMKKNDVSMRQTALKMETNPVYIRKWIKERTVTDVKLQKLADAYGCDIQVKVTFVDRATRKNIGSTDIDIVDKKAEKK